MSTDDGERARRTYREFLDLMPLTVNIAGLPISQGHTHYNTEQMELRAATLLTAFRFARQIARDAIRDSPATS